jgi:hypothetical protein
MISFITVAECVYCEVRIGYLCTCIVKINFSQIWFHGSPGLRNGVSGVTSYENA